MTGSLAALLSEALARASHPIGCVGADEMAAQTVTAVAEQVADGLRAGDVGADEPVLVSIGNRPADLGAVLGVWRSGAVAVPVHASAAPSTRQALLSVTGARYQVNAGNVSALGHAPPARRPLLDGAALVIFTSGTTGLPKGVVIGHDRFRAKLDVLDRLLRLGHQETVVVPLQLTFIFGLWLSLLALASGARLRLVPRFSAETVIAALREGRPVLGAVPSMLRALLAAPALRPLSLGRVLTGGEALGRALGERLGSAFPGAQVYDLYGLTETGSCDFCLRPSDLPSGLGTIGAPTEGVTFRIAAEDGSPAPAGVAGELQIRTPFGMLGYLDAPDLTRASLTDGYFRTGDLAWLRPDGRVEIVGRSKEIISRGGHKIAPLEIDNLLCAHPEVAAALCTSVPDERLGEAVHAVVVLAPGARATAQSLRDWASARTERFKVPDRIHLAEALPAGSTGKASRSAARALALERLRSG